MSLLVVGSVAFDSVETPQGKAEEVLGGSATFFSAAASFFAPVRLVAVVGTDFPDIHMDFFKTRGVDMTGLQRMEGKTFRWSGRYHCNMNDRDTICTELNVFSLFSPDIPKSYMDSNLVFLGNIAPSLQLRVLQQVASPLLVACDTMNYWISSAPEELCEVINKVQVLVINDEEARQLSGEQNLVKAAKSIKALGPKYLVIKRGEHGSILFSDDSTFVAPAFPLEVVFDPTGAGDTFAGGLMGYLAQEGKITEGSIRRAMVMGTIMASFCVEDFSIRRFQTLDASQIDSRMELYRRLTMFDQIA